MTTLYDSRGNKIVPSQKELTRVIAHIRRDPAVFNGYLQTIRNPDRVLSMKDGQPTYVAKGLDLYSEMQRDSQIKSSLNRRFNAVLTRTRMTKPIKGLEKNNTAIDAAAAFLENLEQLFLQETFRNILFCIWYGFSIQELIWRPGDTWQIDSINDIEQRRFLFDWDGNPRLLSRENMLDGEELPQHKFIVVRYNTEASNPYGHGLAQDLFWVWWFKRHGLKYWMVYLDKLGTPTSLGYHPRNAVDTEIDLVLESLGMIGQDSAIAVPEGFKVDLLEAKRSSSGDFDKLIGVCDDWISKLILGTSSGINESKFGTRAQATVQVTSEHDNVELDSGYLEYAINKYAVPQWCAYNLGKLPLFVFEIDKERPENKLEAAQTRKHDMQTIRGYVSMGLKVSQAEIRERNNLREPTKDEPVLEKVANQLPKNVDQEKEEKEEGEDTAEHSVGHCPTCGALKESIADFGELDRVVPYDQADSDLLTIIRQTAQATEREFDTGLQKLENRIQSFKDHQTAIDWLLDTAPGVLKNIGGSALFSGLFFSGLMGRYHVERELEDENYAGSFDPLNFGSDWAKRGDPLPPKEAISFFKGKIPLKPSEFKELSDIAKARAFSIAGVNNLELLFEVKELITKSLEAGETFAEFKKRIPAELKKAVKKRHLETVYLQNTLTAYSIGRWERLTSPAVQKSHPYFEYRAVGDIRTRPVHLGLSGLVYPQGHSFWHSWWPPNGFRCRCRAIPRTQAYIERKRLTVSKKVPVSVSIEGKTLQVLSEPGFSTNVAKDYFQKGKKILKEIAELEPVKARTYKDYKLPEFKDLQTRALKSDLADTYDQLKSRGLSDGEIREYYKQIFRKSLSIPKERSFAGKSDFQDWEVIFHENKIGDLTAKAGKQEKEKYLTVLSEIIRDPDEVWVNGHKHNKKGGILKKKYIRKLEDDKLLVVEDVEGEWQAHEIVSPSESTKIRAGVLMHKNAA